MEKLRLYLTRKNVYLGNVVIGIVAIVLGILYLSAGGNVSSLDDLGNALSLLKFMCVLFYIDLFFFVAFEHFSRFSFVLYQG